MSNTKKNGYHAKSILFVPRIEKGKGGGHLIRSASYTQELRNAGIEAFIFVPDKDSPVMRNLSSIARINPEWIISSEPEKKDLSFIVLDNFKSGEDEYLFWTNIAPVIAVDEGGPRRDSFDFLIDILPGLLTKSKANISGAALLPLPKNRRTQFAEYIPGVPLKVLAVFGAEDASGMGLLLAEKFASIENAVIDVVQKNHLHDEKSLPENIRLIEPFSGLSESLYRYDLVLTHFGITAFEAIYAKVPVLLASPTKYHEQLAKKTGFLSIGIKKHIAKKNVSLFVLSFMEKIISASKKISEEQGLVSVQTQSFIDLVKTADCTVPKKCPVCGESSLKHPVTARFDDRTYRRCKRCSMEYMLRLHPPSIQYTEDYFFSDYKKQYGKTYLEDFPHLVNMAKSRLLQIKKLLKKNTEALRVLDIGCAYGPFLQAAKEETFEVFGIDPSEDAVKYVTCNLNVPSFQGFFPDIDLPRHIVKDGFDIISLWYVIEHFEDTEAALKKISSWLKPGGILAFSTPSGMGISARRNRKLFLEKSPADHWTVWNPWKTKNALKPYHLTLQKIIVTGHHPERFPLMYKKKGLMYKIVYQLSKYFKLGDTFEAYAFKI